MNKRLIFTLYTLVVVCIGFATVIEKYRGTSFVGEHIYGAWWFFALWAMLTVTACIYILRQRLYKRAAVMLLHASFVVILIGALFTHLFARQGSVKLRTKVPQTVFVDKAGRENYLPFSLTLKEFRIINYPGTDAPLDYQSVIQSGDEEMIISMNNIGHINGYRLFQSDYDSDGQGVSLGISYDPYGIAITYTGYLLLLISVVATLLSRKTQMRVLYRKAMCPLVLLLFTFHFPLFINAAPQTVDKDIAHRLGTVNVLYNNRICPLNTVATDFVTKLSGNASWKGYSADEIFVSWMIYYSSWEQQKLIRVKSRDVQQLLGIDGQWASYNDFLNEYHEYKLKVPLSLITSQERKHHKSLLDADEKFQLIEIFYRGQFCKIFPYELPNSLTPNPSPRERGVCTSFAEDSTVNTNHSPLSGRGVGSEAVAWYSPGGQSLPKEIPVKEQFFIKQSMDYLTESIVTGQRDRAFEIIAKIKLFQRDMIGGLLPSENTTKSEVLYNALRSQKWPIFLALAFSLLLCVVMLLYRHHRVTPILFSFHFLLFSYVSLLLGLRWWLSGHIPVSNGHETMLFMAWVLLLMISLLWRKFPVVMAFGSLMASFCLLVSVLAGSNSQITPLMPVLQSPLLSVHVMTVMCAYALFALQVLLGIQALLQMRQKKKENLERTTALSQLLLYPAVFLLAIGIFLGAVWANVSWGNYWSWDPKESWALITLMVYAVPLHKASVSIFRRPIFYHIYMVSAFLVVIITYFGVNYLLGGMHSYA